MIGRSGLSPDQIARVYVLTFFAPFHMQVTAKDSKLDRIEAQMLDSYDNDKKVAVLARIQVGRAFSGRLQLTVLP